MRARSHTLTVAAFAIVGCLVAGCGRFLFDAEGAADASPDDAASRSDGGAADATAGDATVDGGAVDGGALVAPDDCVHVIRAPSEYLFCSRMTTEGGAREFCTPLGFHLVTFETAEEDIWVLDRALTAGLVDWWISLNDRVEEGAYRWHDGSLPSFTRWGNGEPNDFDGSEDCVMMPYTANNGWNDTGCENLNQVVCERSR